MGNLKSVVPFKFGIFFVTSSAACTPIQRARGPSAAGGSAGYLAETFLAAMGNLDVAVFPRAEAGSPGASSLRVAALLWATLRPCLGIELGRLCIRFVRLRDGNEVGHGYGHRNVLRRRKRAGACDREELNAELEAIR